MLKLRWLSILFVAVILSACGGGGGSSADTSDDSDLISVVTASAVALGNVSAESNVSLDASASSDSLNSSLSYLWSQTSGTTVTIDNTSAATTRFIAPAATDAVQTLVFQLIVTSATGSDSVTVTATIAAAVILEQPNILFIISDDQGLDTSAQYHYSTDLPVTPTINALAESGIVFENAWATPACTTTRGTIITGKYGVNSGVSYVPAVLSSDTREQDLLQEYLQNNVASENYQSAVFGKWHLGGGRSTASHPNDVGLDYYAGNLENLDDYYNWTLTVNGEQTANVTDYHTSKLTDLAIEWIAAQQANPWFAWLAYSAPHSPFHLPPVELLPDDSTKKDLPGGEGHITVNRRDYYLAAVEAMDTEIGRLLDSLDSAIRENTIIIYLGDNGTPTAVIDNATYQSNHAKGSLYQGGVAVPLVISGKGVTRMGVREDALVTATDLYATIGQLAGISASEVHDSSSFIELLADENASSNNAIFTSYKTSNNSELGWGVRSSEYKLVKFEDGSEALYDLSSNFSETSNLLPSNDSAINTIVSDLTTIGEHISGENSTQPLDITDVILTKTSANCVDYIKNHTSTVNDVHNSIVFNGDLAISQLDDKCIFSTNGIPNHDFNDGEKKFPNDVSEQDVQFAVTITPSHTSKTALSLQVDNAILFNGVKIDLLAAACYGVGGSPLGSEKIGCNDGNDWRYDPMFVASGFNVDRHNAHAQANGAYHYHGSPLALFDHHDDTKASPVIGFAADGFPIFGSYFDDNGTYRKATSSYQLKVGARPTGAGEPGEAISPFAGDHYDGRFRDDYQYVENAGDLDECNGMTVNGVYGYYVTDTFPYVLACFSGSPDASFNK